MSQKIIEVAGVGPITFAKKKSSRHIRLSISAEGSVRVSLPIWTPYAAGVAFAKQKSRWIEEQIPAVVILRPDMRIGKQHVLQFAKTTSVRLSVRTRNNIIKVNLPAGADYRHPEAQKIALQACIRALKSEGEAMLPNRLRQLAKEHGFKVRSIEVKRLKSRWGSCNHRHEIVLNCFLMQLPWDLIDYVILHELVHTKIMAHGSLFWTELAKYVPDLPSKRKAMRQHRPTIRETFSVSGVA